VQISELISATQQALRELPEKKYFTMGEVEAFTQVAAHQLRNWEKEVTQLAPSKRLGRRYYQPSDIEKILLIKALMAEGLGLKESSEALKQIDKAKRLHKLPEKALADEQGDLFAATASASLSVSEVAAAPNVGLSENQAESQVDFATHTPSPAESQPTSEPRKITLPSTRIQQLLQEAKRLRALA
jgi:DNA-binding transcriptional MerR regulator